MEGDTVHKHCIKQPCDKSLTSPRKPSALHPQDLHSCAEEIYFSVKRYQVLEAKIKQPKDKLHKILSAMLATLDLSKWGNLSKIKIYCMLTHTDIQV